MDIIFPGDLSQKSVPVYGDYLLTADSSNGEAVIVDVKDLPISVATQTAITNISLTPGPPGADGANGSITQAPPGASQTVNDNVVPVNTSTVTTDDTTYIKVTRTDGSYTEYNLTGIYEYDSDGDKLTQNLITGVFGAQAITYADINGSVDKTTGIFTFNGEIAYRNIPNVFTNSNVFDGDVTFKKRISTPYYDMGSKNASFDFDNLNADYQKVTLTGAADKVCTFKNLTAGVKSLAVVQDGTGKLDFAVSLAGDNGTVDKVFILGDLAGNKSYDKTVALGKDTYLFTMAVYTKGIHILLSGKSYLNN